MVSSAGFGHHESEMSSAANSDDEGDIPSAALLAPIEVLNGTLNFFSSVYLHVLIFNLLFLVMASDPSSSTGISKKRKRSRPDADGDSDGPPHKGRGRSRRRNSRSAAATGSSTPSRDDSDKATEAEGRKRPREMDVVEMGIISERDARELWDMYVFFSYLVYIFLKLILFFLLRYFRGCYRLLACFNPQTGERTVWWLAFQSLTFFLHRHLRINESPLAILLLLYSHGSSQSPRWAPTTFRIAKASSTGERADG
jgi:hypothetical protein